MKTILVDAVDTYKKLKPRLKDLKMTPSDDFDRFTVTYDTIYKSSLSDSEKENRWNQAVTDYFQYVAS